MFKPIWSVPRTDARNLKTRQNSLGKAEPRGNSTLLPTEEATCGSRSMNRYHFHCRFYKSPVEYLGGINLSRSNSFIFHAGVMHNAVLSEIILDFRFFPTYSFHVPRRPALPLPCVCPAQSPGGLSPRPCFCGSQEDVFFRSGP